MKKYIDFKLAINISLGLFGIFTVFHFGIIIGILFFDFVPLKFLWGGKLETKEQLLSFEIISAIVQSFCMFLMLVKANYFSFPKLDKWASGIFWFLSLLFFVNTIGNFFAESDLEKFVATPVTMILSILMARIAIE